MTEKLCIDLKNGYIFSLINKRKKIYSTKFSNKDIKIILGTNDFNIIENYDNLIFKILDKTFTIPKSLYLTS